MISRFGPAPETPPTPEEVAAMEAQIDRIAEASNVSRAEVERAIAVAAEKWGEIDLQRALIVAHVDRGRSVRQTQAIEDVRREIEPAWKPGWCVNCLTFRTAPGHDLCPCCETMTPTLKPKDPRPIYRSTTEGMS